MSKATSLGFAALGISLVAAGILIKRHSLFDPIANISFPYHAGILGFAVLVVGLHCVLFDSLPRDLPLRPNVVLFVLIAVAANANIVWDGIVSDFSDDDIWWNLCDSLEFSFNYAAFLFLPRWPRKQLETSGEASSLPADATAK